MNRTIRLISLGFALSGLMLAGSLQSGEPPPPNLAGKTQFAYCMSGYLDYNDPNAYFSPVFEIHVPQNAKLSYPEDLANVYEGYLKKKHGYVRTGRLSVICTFSVSAAAVQGGKDVMVNEKQHQKRSVVETGWRPSAQEISAAANGAAAPVAAAPPTANPPLTVHAYCKGDQQGKPYFSALFSSVIQQPTGQPVEDQLRPLTDTWKNAFMAYLTGQYGFSGTTGCYAGPDLQPIEWTWNRQRGLALGRKTDTGWTPGG
jgi:hypothetical protein